MAKIISEFDGLCPVCGGEIHKGDTVYWNLDTGEVHYSCIFRANFSRLSGVKRVTEKWLESNYYD